MAEQRQIEIFSADCPACTEAVTRVRELACPSCAVTVLDMHDAGAAGKASRLGIRSVPAIVVDGKLAACCAGTGPDEGVLRAAGIGEPLP